MISRPAHLNPEESVAKPGQTKILQKTRFKSGPQGQTFPGSG